jgi:hypothetical protein
MVSRLGTVRAVLRALPRLDREECTDLYLAGLMVLPVDDSRFMDQLEEGAVVDLVDLRAGPVGTDTSHRSELSFE